MALYSVSGHSENRDWVILKDWGTPVAELKWDEALKIATEIVCVLTPHHDLCEELSERLRDEEGYG